MTIGRARRLRKSMPPAEARMWNLLRLEPFRPFHFRRQLPLGRYFADFASHSARVIIEIDGDTHYQDAAIRYDAIRDAFLRSEGYGIIRFTNSDVLGNRDGIAEVLLAKLEVLHTRPGHAGPPSPQGGGRGADPKIPEES